MMTMAAHPALERLAALTTLNGFYQALGKEEGAHARRLVLATPSVLHQERE